MKMIRRTVLGSAAAAALALAAGALTAGSAAAQDTIKIGAPFNVTVIVWEGFCPGTTLKVTGFGLAERPGVPVPVPPTVRLTWKLV